MTPYSPKTRPSSGVQWHIVAGQLGGSWLQFSLHHSSVAPLPGTAWHCLPGAGGVGGLGGGEGGGGEGGGGGGVGVGGQGGAGLGDVGIAPLHRGVPASTAAHIACATYTHVPQDRRQYLTTAYLSFTITRGGLACGQEYMGSATICFEIILGANRKE